ncbi:MAG: SLC45 family MFS transporter [Flammeovirgaceae bacterium]
MLEIQRKLTQSFLVILSLPATAMGFALSVQISALSWILSTKYNLDIHEVGIVWAAGPLAGIVGQVLIGIVSDKVWFWNGRRRPFILIGGVLASLMLLALPNIDVISNALGLDGILGVALVVALTLDLAINISFNPTRSIIADVTDAANRTKGYTWMQTISGTFGVLAYAIGAQLGNYTLIYFGAVLVLLFSLIPPFFITEPKDLNNEGEKAQKREFSTLVDNDINGFYRLLFAHAFTWLGVQTMFVYMFAFIKHKLPAMDDTSIGSVISISFLILNLVAAILPAFVLEPVTKAIGRVKTHIICIASMSIAYAGIAFLGTTASILYVMMAIAGIGWAATVSLPFAIMSEKVDQRRMGFYMGIFNLSVVLPQLVASIYVGKIINDADDKNITFIICAISLAISAALWSLVKEVKSAERTPMVAGGGH